MQLVFLLRGNLGSGCQILTSQLADHLGVHHCVENCRRIMSSTAKQTEAKIDLLFQKAKNLSPVVIHLEEFEIFGLDAENNEDLRIVNSFVKKLRELYDNFDKFPIIFIATCDTSVELKSNLSRIFLDEFIILNPNRQERLEILSWLSITKEMLFCDENFKPYYTALKNIKKEEVKEIDKCYVEINKTNISIQNKSRRAKLKGVGKKSKNNPTKGNVAASWATEIEIIKKIQNESQCIFDDLKTVRLIENDLHQSSPPYTIHDKAFAILEKVSSKTDCFLYGDLDMLINISMINGHIAQQKLQSNIEFKGTESFSSALGCVREKDFEDALESLRLIQSKKLGVLRIPNVSWEDIGGLENLKKEIFRTIELPLKFPHLLANSGLKRSGLLLWGPPGCGKTLVARAISSQLRAAFLSVKGPELLDMYVGQSERNMRDMFAMARASAPCVIFLDEAEAAAGARGASGDAGGAADRLVSQLLAELDGVSARQLDSQTGPVIVVAATNRPDLVEPALLRPGRLDKLLYVGPYRGTTSKVRVLSASARGFNISSDVSLETIADQLPDQCTGADLTSVVNKARRSALARTIQQTELDEKDASMLTENSVTILKEDFQKALTSFVPSISEREMNHYESLRSKHS